MGKYSRLLSKYDLARKNTNLFSGGGKGINVIQEVLHQKINIAMISHGHDCGTLLRVTGNVR